MNTSITMISTDLLQVDARYQRPVNPLLVSKIANHYSAPLFAPLLVAERTIGEQSTYYVVDGQHRLEAARLLRIPEVPCFVYKNMSSADEATLFVNQQIASRRLTPRDTYKANIFIGNPQNVDVIIDQILHKYDHRIGIHEHDTSGWYAIVALRDTVKKVGADGLRKILIVLNTLGWTNGRAAKSRLMLVGIGRAVQKGLSVTEIVTLFKDNYSTPEEFIAAVTVSSKGRKHTIVAAEVVDNLIRKSNEQKD